MAALDVQKFGGNEKLGKAKVNEYDYEMESIETRSKTNLERDEGWGDAAIIRCFTFGINQETWKERPSRQDLFNAHIKGIETMLWRDGMKLMIDVQPRILIRNNQYKIFVGAKPMKGHILKERPRTLKQIVYG